MKLYSSQSTRSSSSVKRNMLPVLPVVVVAFMMMMMMHVVHPVLFVQSFSMSAHNNNKNIRNTRMVRSVSSLNVYIYIHPEKLCLFWLGHVELHNQNHNPPTILTLTFLLRQAAESEVSFDNLDGSNVRIGIIRTRWNDEHVTNLVQGIQKSLQEVNVPSDNIFETSVPGAYELPMAARFLALSQTVDAIICCGVLIKGDTLHFEYIADAVSKGIMNVGLQTNIPCIFGVLTCLNEEQVKARSSGNNNHGEDWGKTAVEMALLRNEAIGMMNGGKSGAAKLEALGFDKKSKEEVPKKTPGFF